MHANKRFQHLHEQYCSSDNFLQPDRLLQRAADTWPNRTAVVCGDDNITYQALYAASTHITIALRNKDIGPNSHVLLIYENSIPFFICYYGIWQTGAVVAPLNTYLSHDELAHIVKDFQPSLIIASEKQKEKFDDIATDAPIVTHDDLNSEPEKQAEHIDIPDRDPDKHAAVLYTSGTTGYPKGVMLSSRNIITNSIQGIALFDIQEHERVVASVPLFHSFMQNACVWSTFLIGATTIVIPHISRSAITQALSHKPTMLPTIPQLYGLLCRLKDVSLSGIKLCVSGGDALADKIRMAVALRFRRRVCNGYGLTETSPFISVNLEDKAEAAHVIGYTVPGVEIDICDDSGKSMPRGEVGTLWVKGDNVMLGYYNAPEATKEVLHNGWFNTGDLVQQGRDGKLMLCGRAKDLIIHKGINIYPQEIENVLMTHPNATMAGVIAKHEDDEEWPVAFVAVSGRSNMDAVETELYELCQDHLAHYKVPVAYYVRKNLPSTATGKVDKKELRKELEEN